MVKKYKITYTTGEAKASPKIGHMDSSHIQSRIIHLADTVFVGWAVEVLGDITDNVTEKSYFPPGDGEAVEIDAKWGLNKRRHATAGCTKIVTEHTNDSDYIKRIKFIMKWLCWEEWTCDPIHLGNQEELEEVQPSWEFCGRTCGRGNKDDEDDERGDQGWITRTLFDAVEQTEVLTYKEAARVRREEAENVQVVRYFVRVNGRMKPREGGTNSERVLENIDLINEEIAKKDPCKRYLWETWVPPIKDDKSLTDLQESDGGCIRVRERGEDYGDKVDDIHEVDKKWYREEGPQYSGSESEDDEEDYFEECYEGTWSTRDRESFFQSQQVVNNADDHLVLIAQDKAMKIADRFPSRLRLETVRKKTLPSTEKRDFKKGSKIRKEERSQDILRWMERQG
ncbi:uncharacterized protein J4E92_004899 [Alternaria infectoria]|uniref:uncharacterized protein n=1 Tax=Alternaria infectoria TaxID=45303 RepID=UPI002220EBBF|nr:uncharacterized protein J4E92_004899 [Alternaria infectoria]KAI4929236.1 hypothetical protein J4E92_004899 [Alternaria infectoria]